MIRIQAFTFNPFQENTYVLYDDTLQALVIDPGCYEKDEIQLLDRFIESNGLEVKSLLNTHCHIDHVLGNYHVQSTYNVPLYIHRKEEEMLRAVQSYASNYGFANYHHADPDGFLEEGESVSWGESQLDVLFVPGHSPGHVAFYHASQSFVVAGDVLFQGSIGRTDLPGGSMETLLASIRKKMFTLPDDVIVYCGHGPETTIGEEKISNPFCAVSLR